MEPSPESSPSTIWSQVGAGGGGGRETVVMNSCMDMMAKIPAEFYKEQVSRDYPSVYEESMNTVLIQVNCT